MNIVNNRGSLAAAETPLDELVSAYCSQPTRQDAIDALKHTIDGIGEEFMIDPGGMWDLRCHYEAIRLLKGMKEEA